MEREKKTLSYQSILYNGIVINEITSIFYILLFLIFTQVIVKKLE